MTAASPPTPRTGRAGRHPGPPTRRCRRSRGAGGTPPGVLGAGEAGGGAGRARPVGPRADRRPGADDGRRDGPARRRSRRQWSDDELAAGLRTAAVPFTTPEDHAEQVADVLASNGVVAWFDGRSDGTARSQTVDPAGQPRLGAVLEAFRRRTGLPVVITTSLNTAGRLRRRRADRPPAVPRRAAPQPGRPRRAAAGACRRGRRPTLEAWVRHSARGGSPAPRGGARRSPRLGAVSGATAGLASLSAPRRAPRPSPGGPRSGSRRRRRRGRPRPAHGAAPA